MPIRYDPYVDYISHQFYQHHLKAFLSKKAGHYIKNFHLKNVLAFTLSSVNGVTSRFSRWSRRNRFGAISTHKKLKTKQEQK